MGVNIPGEPIAQLRNPVGEIKTCLPIAHRITIHMHRESALHHGLQGQRIPRSAIEGRLGHTDFKIRREFETDLAATEKWLQRKASSILPDQIPVGYSFIHVVAELLSP